MLPILKMYLQFYCNQVDNPHSPEDGWWHDYCGWDRSSSQSVGGNSEDHDWNRLGRLHCSMAPQHCLLQSTFYLNTLTLFLCLPVRFILLEWTSRSAGSGTKWWSMFLESRRGSWRLRRKKVIILIIKSLYQIQLHDISDETMEGVVINMETQDWESNHGWVIGMP